MLINTWQELVSVELQQVPTLNCTDVHKNFIFEQDGAPPHFHRNVTTFLDETFPGRHMLINTWRRGERERRERDVTTFFDESFYGSHMLINTWRRGGEREREREREMLPHFWMRCFLDVTC